MTTKTDDIKLPPLPPRDDVLPKLGDRAIGYSPVWNERSMLDYGAACARAAVAANRREYLDTLKLARAIVNGHRRDNPPEDSVEADRQRRMPSDDELKAWGQEEEFFLFCNPDEFLDIVKSALSRYGSSQPAANAEPPKLTDDEIERLVIQLGVTWKEDAWKIEDADLHPMARALLYRYTTAPVAAQSQTIRDALRDAVAAGISITRIDPSEIYRRASQDQKNDETLADTQRAIIEAAEQRGYARAKSECGRDHENAKRYTWLRDHPPKDCQGGMRVRIWGESGDWTSISGEKLDVAIDAAWAAKGADHD